MLKEKYGSWAFITGASSGIGEEFAIQLAGLKFNLVLVARRENRLNALTQELIREHGIDVRIISLDLGQPDFLLKVQKETQGLDIGLLINNAGFAITGDFLDGDIENQISMLNVNCRAPLLLTSYFGSFMKERRRGAIINVSSASAFLPVPGWSVYSASKVFLLHFTEALWHELRQSGVEVLAACPGATITEFAQRASIKTTGMNVQKVVAETLKNLSKGPSVVLGIKNRLGIFLFRFLTRMFLVKLGARVIKYD
jgi:uncharacterized protein